MNQVTIKDSNITREMFDAYETVRESGLTNMWDSTAVIELAQDMSGVTLSRQEIVRIMKNYTELKNKFA